MQVHVWYEEKDFLPLLCCESNQQNIILLLKCRILHTLNDPTSTTYLEVVVPSISFGFDSPSVSFPTP